MKIPGILKKIGSFLGNIFTEALNNSNQAAASDAPATADQATTNNASVPAEPVAVSNASAEAEPAAANNAPAVSAPVLEEPKKQGFWSRLGNGLLNGAKKVGNSFLNWGRGEDETGHGRGHGLGRFVSGLFGGLFKLLAFALLIPFLKGVFDGFMKGMGKDPNAFWKKAGNLAKEAMPYAAEGLGIGAGIGAGAVITSKVANTARNAINHAFNNSAAPHASASETPVVAAPATSHPRPGAPGSSRGA